MAQRPRQQKAPPADLSQVETERVYKVELPQEGMRVDKFLLERTPWLSRTKASSAFDEERVLKNDLPVAPGKKLRAGDLIKLILPPPHEDIAEMGSIPFDVLYEDEGMFVVSKPPHLIVHPAGGYRYLTLLNALHLRFQAQGVAPRLVNRIDKETSGLVICGKTAGLTGELGKALEDKTVVKDYLALVEGVVEQDHQFINLPIGQDTEHHISMLRRVDPNGQHASTEVWVVERLGRFSMVRCRLHTGRMHQIRVHMKAIGHPLVCDHHYGIRDELLESDMREPAPEPTRIKSPYGFDEGDTDADVSERIKAVDTIKRHEYEAICRGERVARGDDSLLLGRCALHSHYLKLTHPETNAVLELTAPLPQDMARAVERIRSAGAPPAPPGRTLRPGAVGEAPTA